MNRRDALILAGLGALVAIFFAPVLFGGAVLVPFDDLFRFPPWSAFAVQFGATTPKNELVLDLVLENYAWKHLIVDALQAHQIPLWNPYLFAGIPFLAAGQHSALYPFSILFYVLPIANAFGYFVALQLMLAAWGMYAFGRVLRLSRFAATISAVVYAFSGFMVVSTAFPMVISAAAWLPAILACTEIVLRSGRMRQILFGLIGAMLIAVQFLAGHVEISIYVLIVTACYALWRGVSPGRKIAWRGLAIVGGMTALGIVVSAVQLVPLFELVQGNFRSGSVTLDQVIGWAFPSRQVLTFLMPDFFGNPTAHSYVDIFDFVTRPAPTGTIFWGIKNYVEAGAYTGILPLALAAIVASGLAAWTKRVLLSWRRGGGQAAETTPNDTHLAQIAFFALLAVVSLLFVFGTPLYGILFYLVPGFNQLHTPFRWVFPYTLSIAVLAGIGVQMLQDRPLARVHTVVARVLVWVGVGALVILGVSWVLREQTLGLVNRLVNSSSALTAVFGDGRSFYSYEFRNVLLLAVFATGAGAIIWVAHRPIYLPRQWGEHAAWKPLALFLVVLDLFVAGMGFYPTANPRLAQFTPPAVQFLQQDPSLYRITSYDKPGEKMFNPNAGMFYGISDIRGYDSIIPKQYADLMGLLAPQEELLYNRVAPFYQPEPFDSPVLDLLNVKYVLTTRPLPNAGYTLVYDQEIQIYRNDHVLPRAFVVPQARVIADRAALLDTLKTFDPASQVLLEQEPGYAGEPVHSSNCGYTPVTIASYTNTEVIVTSDQACPGWLVLSDSYFPGWIAQIDGQDTTLYKADYNFRAVYLRDAGPHTIRFKYSPVSFRVGAIGSFLGIMCLVLGFAYLAWNRFYRGDTGSEVQVLAKNSLLPMATSLLMKVMDLAFAFFSLRVLGPTGTGRYAWAVGLWLFANTVTDFGLGILLTREVSRDRSQANRFLTNSLVLRVALWAIALVPFGLIAAFYVLLFNVTLDTAFALVLLLIGILPSTVSASLAFLFNAYERFEYRVAVDVMTRIVSITLGVIMLLLGFGYIGLAAASILTNVFTLVAFYFLVRAVLFVPRIEWDGKLVRWMAFESYPLMLNNLLSSLFFRIDALILLPLWGDTVLGYYSTAYKFIEALNFIPSNFTLAIFPALSRLTAAKNAMLRAYTLSLKILLVIALPITVGTMFVAHELIRQFGGEAYLPHSAIALQILIWFLPFSFVNSVTHYVLIALGQQRFLTKAFLVGVAFNIAANLVAIPPLGYAGAALVTILSEVVLLLPFYYSVRRNLGTVPFWSLAWRPGLAAGIMGLALWWMVAQVGLLAAVPLAGVLYVAVLIVTGALGEDERLLLRRLLPARVHRLVRIAE